jgi:hypothetical protein
MSTFFSKHSWSKWWRNRRYDFNVWQISQIDENKEPKPNILNCMGWRINNARENLTQIGIERVEEEKKKLQNQKDDSEKEYLRCVLEEQNHTTQYKRVFDLKRSRWTNENKRENAQKMKTDPEFLAYYKKALELKAKTTAQQKNTNRIEKEIEKYRKHIASLQYAAERISTGDEKFDINKHMGNLLPMITSANLKFDTAEDTANTEQFNAQIEELKEKENARDIEEGIGIGSGSGSLTDDELGAVIAALMSSDDGSSKKKQKSSSAAREETGNRGSNRGANSYKMDDLGGYDNDNDYDDDDDENTLFLGARNQKNKSKNGQGVLVTDDDTF